MELRPEEIKKVVLFGKNPFLFARPKKKYLPLWDLIIVHLVKDKYDNAYYSHF